MTLLLGVYIFIYICITYSIDSRMITVPATGPVLFSHLKTVFGGVSDRVLLSAYYTNATPSYTAGVAGIPASGSSIGLGMFRGKSKAST